jgi:hypothetical protein
LFFTKFTNKFYHFYASKIKAAFGGLKETVKFLHLLAASVVKIKNPFLSSGISIALFLVMSINVYCQETQDRFYVLTSFEKGLNSHASSLILNDNQATVSQNVRINSRYGSLAKRGAMATIWDAGDYAINSLHRYYKSDGTAKLILATSTYLDVGDTSAETTTHISSGLSDGKRWQFTTFKDMAIGTNGYDQPLKYDGKTTTTANTDGARTVGELCAELGAPFAELQTGTHLTASRWYQYKMMFLVSGVTYYSNARSNPIVTGSTVRDITLTDIPIGPVGTTERYIYRTAANTSQANVEADTTFYLCATISDNTTTTADDTVTDAALVGYTAWSTAGKYNCTPPTGKYLTVHKERLWVGGNTTYNSELYFSDDGNPDFFDPDDFFAIRADDGDSITFLKTFLGVLTIGKTNSIQKLYTDGDATTDWYLSDPFSFIGSPAPYTVSITPIGIFYLGRGGLYNFNGVNSSLISDAVTPEIYDISYGDINNAVGVYANNEYRLAYISNKSGATTNNRVLVYDLIRDAYVLDTTDTNCFSIFNSSTDTGAIYYGSSLADGKIRGGTYSPPSINIRYKSEIDSGSFDDTYTGGTETIPLLSIGWDCTIDTWLTELQTKDASITTIDSVGTYLPDATIDTPGTDGTWTSPIYYINAQTLDKLYWNENLGAYGDVTFQVRLGANAGAVAAASWETAVTNPNGSDLSGITANTYIQIRANLSTTDITYLPLLYQTDGYLFRLLYERIGSDKESSVTSVYKTGWKNFGVTGYKKMIKRIKVFYTGTSGDVLFNIKGGDGDIDKTFTINLSVEPDFSTTDEYSGDEGQKIYTFYPSMNSETDPSLISQLFQFTLTETGTISWEINRIEFMYEVLPIY